MTSVCVCFLVLLTFLHMAAGCPPSRPSLDDILDKAILDNRQGELANNLINLPELSPKPDMQMYSRVTRPRLGQHAHFSCRVPANNKTNPVYWLHQGKIVFKAMPTWGRQSQTSQDDTGTQKYSMSWGHQSGTLRLTIERVSLRSGGAVLCVRAPSDPAYIGQARVLQRFLLLPLITRASQVFAATASDPSRVTVTEGDSLTVACSVRLPLPNMIFHNIDNHIMWRHQGHIIKAPTVEPYGALGSYHGVPSNRFNHSLTSNSPGQLFRFTYYKPAVTRSDAGPIQFLFRPHQEVDEWVFKSITLSVLPKSNTPESH
ncbi:uncharacterized protein LOC129581997 [Paramacrobiotus metropolitanus]|uniref:uncharacterized protein LOC129581997 n=1 Tax=Paramacrobiotus metropolitanus TaxID=2943436 RepID=UPI0024459E25|nr:uncharacterized protein LOC129581997 [Paramacrobiotus metropolitanus]